MELIQNILSLLTKTEKKQGLVLLLLFILMAMIQMIGIASIMPFMAVLTNPDLVETNDFLRILYSYSNKFGFETKNQFLFLLGVLVFIFLIISLMIKAVTTYFQIQFVTNCQYNITKRLAEGYLHQPYSWFLNRNSADLGQSLLSEVATVVSKGLGPLINLTTQILIICSIIILLIFIDPFLTVVISLVFGFTYGLIYRLTKNLASNAGKERLNATKWLFSIVNEAFGAVKEIKINGLEKIYTSRFSSPAQKLAKYNAVIGMISQLPRYFLEMIIFGGMLFIVLYLLIKTGDFSNFAPLLALYAYAGYRLMPALQQLYVSLTSLKFVSPSVKSLSDDFKNISIQRSNVLENKLSFLECINLKNISYTYPNGNNPTIKNLNLKIPIKNSIGIVGPTGSGKTTLVDVILGLLEPQSGTIKIDDVEINKNNLRAWQKMIGYVPQQIYLSDDTIASNIAFGVENNLIDMVAVENAAKVANIHEFIVNELPNKYQTSVGERGIRLSGGQRQRIGIARALYHKPKILFLDEATSALDNNTEKLVMEGLHHSDKNMTIIMIAHRLSTVSKCNNVLLLKKGIIKAQGKIEDLVKEKQ